MIILASNSPRRKQLLAHGGWSFQVNPVHIDESLLPGEQAEDYVLRLCVEKAKTAWQSSNQAFSHEDVILAADTAVAIRLSERDEPGEHQILGKPADRAEAESILYMLRGRTHQVYTGMAALRAGDGKTLTDVVVTDVCMRAYTDLELQAYIDSGDPFDKAGAYAIQHTGFHPVQELHGCYANVMGLPVCRLAGLLENFNLPTRTGLVEACQQALNTPCPIFGESRTGESRSSETITGVT